VGQRFSQTNAALDRTERNAKQLNSVFSRMHTRIAGVGKIAGGVFGGIMASRIVAGIRAMAAESFDAGMEVLNVQEKLRALAEAIQSLAA
jgi:hypothetical protein